MTHMRTILPTLIFLLSTACISDKGYDGPIEMTYWDIATFEGNIDGSAQFTVRQVNDSPEATLYADRIIPIPAEGEGDDPTGKRVFISYVPESNKPYTSGQISLRSAAVINQSPLRIESISEYPEWARDKVYLYSAWRTGSYINFHVSITYDREPRIFCIVADEQTIGTSCPELYLVHIMAEPTDYHERRYYASFDISEIWERPEVLGVNLHVSNSNLDKQIFTFRKNN